MAWIKVPKEHHPIYRAALPSQPRSVTNPMFGGLATMVNGNLACGLFARSVMVRLGGEDRARALALDGAGPFDPMGRGASHDSDKIMLPDDVMDDDRELRGWLQRAVDHAATLPPKAAKPKAAKPKAAKPKPAKPKPASRSRQR